MEGEKGLKLFISYCHEDNPDGSPHVREFIKHITPLQDIGLLREIWWDGKILPGEDYQERIDSNLEDADVVCLIISANSLFSGNCKAERREAHELWKVKRVPVIPIILSSCGWMDDRDMSRNLALPTDGKPILELPNEDTGWQNVYCGLKAVVEKEIGLRQLRIQKEFGAFLQGAEMLSEAHPRKETVLLDDVFVSPDLSKYGSLKESKEVVSLEELLKTVLDYSRLVIVGEERSGKTTICKRLFAELRRRNFIPVYLSDAETRFSGKMENRIREALGTQYEGIEIEKVYEEYRDRIVPIVDDFHLAKNKEKHVRDLSAYSMNVLVVDDVFGLNIREEKLIRSFTYFRIRQLNASLRYDLIKKWATLRDEDAGDDYKKIDERVALVNSILGKTLGRGVMPSYPFFVLSAIVTYETAIIPLDQEITSQGYCYQALIYFYLRKRGVGNTEIEMYLNFLAELAFHIYESGTHKLLPDDFHLFLESYREKFNLPIEPDTLVDNLGLLVLRDSLGSYAFRHLYIYYFFVAKYLAEHSGEDAVQSDVERITDNLHVDENAYIAVFIAHHSRDTAVLTMIKSKASRLFGKFESATLTKDEVSFLDKQGDAIVEAALPSGSTTPEKARQEDLEAEDQREQLQEDMEETREEAQENPLGRELRRAIKTVEVLGSIMRNRAGSLEKMELEDMFRLAMGVHLRILSSFFDLISNEDQQKALIEYISGGLTEVDENGEEVGKQPSREERRELARTMFWNINFFTVYGVIYKIALSLGSDMLTAISDKVCNELDTPASFLVKHMILMWYTKCLHIDEIVGKLKDPRYSEVAKRAIKMAVANYCRLHRIDYKDRQRIVGELGISAIARSIE
jgi:hypothetical protein